MPLVHRFPGATVDEKPFPIPGLTCDYPRFRRSDTAFADVKKPALSTDQSTRR